MGNNDIDFDELDRAVSSLVGRPEPSTEPAVPEVPVAPSASKLTSEPTEMPVIPEAPLQPAQQSQSVVSQPAIPTPPAPSAPMAFSTPPTAPLPPPKEVVSTNLPMRQPEPSVPMKTPERPLPPAVRRSGRFMDVVHPSSDMGVAKTTPRPVSQGPTVQMAQAVETAPEEPNFTFASEPALVEPPKPEPESKWGGSLNFLSRRKKEDDTSKEVSEPSPQVAQQDALISPFLSDAKVEKRPLGAFAGPGEVSPESHEVPSQNINSAADPQAASEALPPELGQDLVAIEAGEIRSDDRPDTPPAYPPEESAQPTMPQAPVAPEKPPVPTVRQAMAATATASIPQQYKVKPAPEDSAPHSLFDADEYRKPLQSAAKKKRGAGTWVVVLLLLLLLGAAAGVAVYFMTGGFN